MHTYWSGLQREFRIRLAVPAVLNTGLRVAVEAYDESHPMASLTRIARGVGLSFGHPVTERSGVQLSYF